MNRSWKLLNTTYVKRFLARALVCSGLLLLPACGIPKFRQAELGPPVPGSYNGAASQENSAQLTVAEFFNDPMLTGLIDHALVNNRELKILDEEVQIAGAAIMGRQGAWLPLVTFGASVTEERYSTFTLPGASIHDDPYRFGKVLPNPVPDFLLGPRLFLPVDIWRELRNERDAARQRYFAAIERRNYFVTRLVADVAQNYYALMALDKRLENLNQVIEIQEKNYSFAKANFNAGRGTELPVQRFLAEVEKNRSEQLILRQDIIETENRINFMLNRFPQPVARNSEHFFDLQFPLSVGLPAQLLQFRPDIRQAERELEAAGLDVKVARARFFPRLDINARAGYEAFNLKYLFWTPESVIASAAADMMVPLINKAAIRADYLSANAKQLKAVYEYQRVILNAYTEVINRMSMVANYGKSIEVKQKQVTALEAAVKAASSLFFAARGEYADVLFSLRDLLDTRAVIIDTRRQQLSGIVNTYQALGGGVLLPIPIGAGANAVPNVPCGTAAPTGPILQRPPTAVQDAPPPPQPRLSSVQPQ